MGVYLIPEDAKHTEKTNEQTEIQTAVKSEIYTKEEVQKLLEILIKDTKSEQSQNLTQNTLSEVEQ